jgi:hypothetical protein
VSDTHPDVVLPDGPLPRPENSGWQAPHFAESGASPPDEAKLWTIPQAARYLGKSRAAIYSYLGRPGGLRRIKFGRAVMDYDV